MWASVFTNLLVAACERLDCHHDERLDCHDAPNKWLCHFNCFQNLKAKVTTITHEIFLFVLIPDTPDVDWLPSNSTGFQVIHRPCEQSVQQSFWQQKLGKGSIHDHHRLILRGAGKSDDSSLGTSSWSGPLRRECSPVFGDWQGHISINQIINNNLVISSPMKQCWVVLWGEQNPFWIPMVSRRWDVYDLACWTAGWSEVHTASLKWEPAVNKQLAMFFCWFFGSYPWWMESRRFEFEFWIWVPFSSSRLAALRAIFPLAHRIIDHHSYEVLVAIVPPDLWSMAAEAYQNKQMQTPYSYDHSKECYFDCLSLLYSSLYMSHKIDDCGFCIRNTLVGWIPFFPQRYLSLSNIYAMACHWQNNLSKQSHLRSSFLNSKR